ncbi:hypothetical protein [Algoriphagus boritolerans]|uniref:hypothetical protein n=1 Tax=Algoriphagus boritolerans TaxID=308111 RepID=UPI002FCE3B45
MKNKVIQQNREGEKKAYWSEEYHINGYESIATLIYSEMKAETFAKIKQPLFMATTMKAIRFRILSCQYLKC